MFLGFFAFNVSATEMKMIPFSAPLSDDDFQTFLEGLTAVNNIYQLEGQGLTQGRTQFEPWASSYWPIHLGLLANRYADTSITKTKIFSENYTNYLSRPAESYIANRQINKLSAAEKYDLLVGDTSWSLTRAMWKKGLDDLAADGGVATWTGICHGWAAATHMETPEPIHSVRVMDVTGTYSIEFYADDVQGLQSFLWAKSSPPSVQAGNRCKQGDVGRDPYLRPIDPSCLDSNPMTWHLAVTNRVGMYKKSFVMDSSSGSEVWNYPIAGYDYSYFNPRTFESTHSLKAAIEPIQNLTADKFSAYRDPRTKYIVGIAMDLFHPSLISARTSSNGANKIETENYAYDLELDENYNIVGGEWYSKSRPDFLWTFPTGSKAVSREDLNIVENWDVNFPLPENFAIQAQAASQRGVVLSKIANALLNESIK